MKDSLFKIQVKLLLQVLPILTENTSFALKGGTAINLFLRNMERFSVDIDLTYTPIEPREKTLSYFNHTLPILGEKIKQRFSDIRWHAIKTHAGDISRLIFSNSKTEIKVDINHTLRGVVNPCKELELCKNAQETFETFLSINCLSFEDIYAGKICAALDRQHPRDLFDVKLLLENEGYTEKLRKTFIVYLISGGKPLSEMLHPTRLNINETFKKEFSGMAMQNVTLNELLDVREHLVDLVQKSFTCNERDFLISLKSGMPKWDLLEIKDADKLPAVQWKLLNIHKMNTNARSDSLEKLKNILNSS